MPSCLQNTCVLNFDGGEGGCCQAVVPTPGCSPELHSEFSMACPLRFRRLKVFSSSLFPAVVTFQVSVFMSYVPCIFSLTSLVLTNFHALQPCIPNHTLISAPSHFGIY